MSGAAPDGRLPSPGPPGWLDRLRQRASGSLPPSGTVLRVLTSTQNCSALIFSIFLGVHLASPILASVGGITAADNTLLVGRAWYLPSETLTIYLPLALHLSSSLAKRLIIYVKTRRPPPITSHLVTGWILPWIVVPHIASHRLVPARSAPPISSLSPSELGYEYVGWGIKQRPLWSYVTYLALVGIASWHAGVGMMKIVSWLKRGRGGKGAVRPVQPVQPVQDTPNAIEAPPNPSVSVAEETTGEAPKSRERVRINGDGVVISKKRQFGLRGIMVVFLGVVGIGLARIARDSRHVSRVMAVRYQAVHDVMGLGFGL